MLEWQYYATNIAIRNAEQYHNQPGVVVLGNSIWIHGIDKKQIPHFSPGMQSVIQVLT